MYAAKIQGPRLVKTHYFIKSQPTAWRVAASKTLKGAIRGAVMRVLTGHFQSATIYIDDEMVAVIQHRKGDVNVAVSRKDLLKDEDFTLHRSMVRALQSTQRSNQSFRRSSASIRSH